MIGFGSTNQGSEKVHGAPLGAADLAAVKTHFGFDPQQVNVWSVAYAYFIMFKI